MTRKGNITLNDNQIYCKLAITDGFSLIKMQDKSIIRLIMYDSIISETPVDDYRWIIPLDCCTRMRQLYQIQWRTLELGA